jgi:hypothetical protein
MAALSRREAPLVRNGKEAGESQGRCTCRGDLTPTGKRSQNRYSLFWNVTHSYLPTFRDNLSIPSATVELSSKRNYSRNAWLLKMRPKGFPKRRYLAANLRCVTSQKSEDFIYAAGGSLKSRKVRLPKQSLITAQNTDTLFGQNAEFLFGLKAGDANTLLECDTVPPRRLEGVPLLRIHSVGWDVGYRKYETKEINKKKTSWKIRISVFIVVRLLLTNLTLWCLMLKVLNHYRKVLIQLHKSTSRLIQSSIQHPLFTFTSQYAPDSVTWFGN